MTNELAKKEMCLVVRTGAEIWIDEEKALRIGKDLENVVAKFMVVEGNCVNVSDIVGIFTPEAMEDLKRRKMGQFKCKYGNWHTKDDDCQCGRSDNTFIPPVVNKASDEVLEEFRNKKK
jgi:hypothetical protein